MIDYEEYVTEQENRKLFNTSIRYTTLLCYQDKLTSDQFIKLLRKMDVPTSVKTGSRFIEEWFELFLAYYEIEQSDDYDIKYNAAIIDQNYNNKLKLEEMGLI